MFIVTASYQHNGKTCDTSNAVSLGEWHGHEFATKDAALDVWAELEDEKAGLGLYRVTYTVEDIGITEAEVVSRSADEWWAVMVGQQTPAEFMKHARGFAGDEVVDYLTSRADGGEDRYHTEGAKSDLADKLVEVIEAQAKRSADTKTEGAPVFAVGATVMLNSGCMVMTVTCSDAPAISYGMDYSDMVECSWAEPSASVYGGTVMQRRWFPVACLATYPAVGAKSDLADKLVEVIEAQAGQ